MTNYERIKQMNVNEMAIYIDCPYGAYSDNCILNKTCTCFHCIKEWLESETED